MFSKSKRFPEAGKDYIPGPGEYEVLMDDSGRHKRYGFLTQTNRFSEGPDPSISSEFYAHNNESTTTSLSISSTTSSNRTSDESRSSPRKASISPMDTINPFEKYRYAMQKEIETLQTKTRKMDATIQTLETEKHDTKALLLDKDQELADLRSKNAMLQKTIQRQEKSTKAAQLQKKIEQLEEALQNSQSEHQKQLQEKDQTIDALRSEVDIHKQSVCNLKEAQQSSRQEHALLEAQLQTLTAQLSESQSNAAQQALKLTDLNHALEDMAQSMASLSQQLETQTTDNASLQQVNHDLMLRLQAQQERVVQLESRLVLKDEEIDALLNTIDERDRALQESASKADASDQRFNVYRDYVDTTVVPHLRGQAKAMQDLHIQELNALLTELHEAKRFINKQAQSMDLLKSNLHWLTVQNTQLKSLIQTMYQEHKNQWTINKKHYHLSHHGNSSSSKKTLLVASEQQQQRRGGGGPSQQAEQENENDDTISFSSKSTVSNYQDNLSHHLDSSTIVLNDSGFGILTEEIK
ncbi:hypothetical protein FB192DRAFT_1462458 [Mucor lusitanicus]|uniref:Uncharacterized protein n=1 Tax=Mucor circinelloides f. lusitanicus TaxID=29924 RepID=A0A8H4EY93_MUCCL|nr:hypothetical protein FB192DRAFT_1462458 [Mucor lusitanicus]